MTEFWKLTCRGKKEQNLRQRTVPKAKRTFLPFLSSNLVMKLLDGKTMLKSSSQRMVLILCFLHHNV